MSRWMVSRVRLFVILVILSVIIGVISAYLSPLGGDPDIATAVLHNGVNWLVGSSLIWGFELFLVPSHYGIAIRRLNFLFAIAVKSVVLVFIVIATALLGRTFFHGLLDLNFLAEPRFYRTLTIVFAGVITLQTVTQLIRIIGGRNLIYFLLGKYSQPVREEKIFMFLDLIDSTQLAKRLGDLGIQKMITRFFFDITKPIMEHSGEIYRYVGDQIIVTWPLQTGTANMRAIRCCFAISGLVQDKASEYKREFGTVPTFRIGLHGGPVVISQCGDQKQEISYFGDTINAAARIEQQCKALDCPLLISAELLDQITLTPNIKLQSMGSVELRGREQETELFTIETE